MRKIRKIKFELSKHNIASWESITDLYESP